MKPRIIFSILAIAMFLLVESCCCGNGLGSSNHPSPKKKDRTETCARF